MKNPEDYSFEIMGSVQERDHALYLFKVSRESSLDNEYLALDFRIIDSKYHFYHKYWPKEMQGSNDILVIWNWQDRYIFFVNDSRCKSIRLFDGTTYKDIPVDKYPYIHSSDRFFSGYSFVDENGNYVVIT